MKERLSVAGQVALGLIVGSVLGKGMEVVAEKVKKVVDKKKGKAS